MANIEVFVSASSLGTGVLSASFYYDDCGNISNILQTSSAATSSIFSRDEFLSGIYLSIPSTTQTIHVRPTNKECRVCDQNFITLT
tara:strand:- start:286 stop:543 length:258 start_codon:yes stop_codon:yes gene_type:complete